MPKDSTPSPSSLQCHCGLAFTRVENLRRHQRTHAQPALKCPSCPRTFTRPDGLKRHIGIHRPRSNATADGESDAVTPHTGTAPVSTPEVASHSSAQSLVSPPYVAGLQDTSSAMPMVGGSNLLDGPVGPPQPSNNAPALAYSGTQQAAHSVHSANHMLRDLLGQSLLVPGMASSNPLSWDTGPLWILQDQDPLDFLNVGTGATAVAGGDGSVPSLVHGGASPERVPPAPQSRVPSPPNPAASDNWPTNYQPRLPFVLGAEGHIEEVTKNPLHDPYLRRWEQFWIDDEIYDRVKSTLRPVLSILDPSGSFIMPSSLWTVNTLISLYFAQFYPQLPILHLPTFSPAKAPPLLIAGFMCIGAFLSKLPGARAFAVDLIELIRRTIGALFEMDSMNLRNAELIHVSLLTSFAALWSGHQRSFELGELSRGLIANLCRKVRLLDAPIDMRELIEHLSVSTVEQRWSFWIEAESRKRLGLAIHLLDMLFPLFFDTPAHLSHGEMVDTVLPCDERFWEAQTATEWVGLVGVALIPPAPLFCPTLTGILVPRSTDNPPPPVRYLNPFCQLIIVQALHHHIWEFRSQYAVYRSMGISVSIWQGEAHDRELSVGFAGHQVWLREALDSWHDVYYDEGDGPMHTAAKVLYHIGCMALRVQLRDLYKVAGKHGVNSSLSALPPLRRWAVTAEASVAVRHAIAALKVLDFPHPTDNIYGPTSAFISILCLGAFVAFSEQQGEINIELCELMGTSMPLTATDVFKAGTAYLASCKEWRISTALALVLAKMTEQDLSATP